MSRMMPPNWMMLMSIFFILIHFMMTILCYFYSSSINILMKFDWLNWFSSS